MFLPDSYPTSRIKYALPSENVPQVIFPMRIVYAFGLVSVGYYAIFRAC
jgi:hypothetical protein